ncbi:unnamed protein product [Meloidogyne enterolobii]|uniref:Uncharacterized protein n=1 Tax=Meloidogyne enterolobii TaxID=390850 RepID=A0ACB1AM32_MELEN
MDIMCRASCGKTENCRKTCNRCKEPRAWACTKTRGRSAKLNNNTKSFVSGGQCAKKTCYNENQCCQQWSRNGVCTDSPDWMKCNCPISCGSCLPRNFTYGACSDYYKRCKAWANAGECAKSDWMKENCRLSCQTCLKDEELESVKIQKLIKK